MLIRRIEVKNFRRLIGPVVINGLKEGLNVISGDNEEGKSTLLQALKAAFFQRHTSTSQEVKEFLPYNCIVRPEVSLDFEVGRKKFSIHKGFCTKPYLAEFRSPTATFQGAEAEEQIRELFKLPAAEKGKKSADLDHGLWSLLWLEQGQATDGLNTSSGGKEALMEVLESDLSMVLSGQSGRSLLKKITVQYNQYYTPSAAKEKGEYREAREQLHNVSQAYVECRQKYEQYKKKLIELADKQDALAKHQRERSLERAKADIEHASKEIGQVERLQLEEQGARQAEVAAQLDYSRKKEKFDMRQELSNRKLSLETQLLENGNAIKTAQENVHQCQAASESLKSKHRSTETDLQTAEKDCQDAEKRDELIKLQQARTDVESQIKSVDELERELKSQTVEFDKISIDPAGLNALRALESQKLEADIRAGTAVTRLVVRPLPSKEASIDKVAISSKEELSLAKKTTITLKDWGEIVVTPGGEDTEERAKAAENKRQELLSALAKLGIATVEEAQELVDKRKQCLSDMEQIKKKIATICGASGFKALQKNLQNIASQIESFGGGAGNFKISAKQVELVELRQQRDVARELEKKAKEQFELAKESLAEATADHSKLTSAKDHLNASVTELDKRLEELSKDDITAQEKILKDAEEKYLVAQNATKLKVLELSRLNPEEIKKKHEACTAACAKLEMELSSLKTDISALTAGIETLGQAGLGEDLERLEGAREVAENEFKRIERKAHALKLLYDTLTDAEQEAKEQFLEPVIEKLNPHLQLLFPGANIILDTQAVEISQLQRNGVDESYGKLSIGTREQLSVLTRLAIARLMHDKGQPGVVVLDDALVYSDDRRIAKMKEVLKEVSSQMQVIILTCRLRDYEDLTDANFIELNSHAEVV